MVSTLEVRRKPLKKKAKEIFWIISDMGGRRFQLSVRRKNAERKRARGRAKMKHTKSKSLNTLTISLPLSAYLQSNVANLDVLYGRLGSLPPIRDWSIARGQHLTLYKTKLRLVGQASRADCLLTVSIGNDFKWTLFVAGSELPRSKCPLLHQIPPHITCVASVEQVIALLDSSKVCEGNSDEKLLKVVHHRSQTLHGLGSSSSDSDRLTTPGATTMRHTDCQVLLPQSYAPARCPSCVSYRATLMTQARRQQTATKEVSQDSHVNYRYQPLPQLHQRLRDLHQENRVIKKRCERLQLKISKATEVAGISLNEETHSDLIQVATENSDFIDSMPKDSVGRIFWQQQLEAASKKNARSMRWHPLMIRWCVHLRHRSSGAYEVLRSSGCLRLPSQRTLRDYSHCIPANTGFSCDVDQMLMETACVSSCPERNKCTLLLLDEMHIREDLVFDKYSGSLIGFTSLGDITDHLRQFEQALSEDQPPKPTLAKTMMVFMVRGLFSSLQFPFAQFACSDLCGDLLYDPFWEAVRRIENCGLKVLGATLDGNSVNRRLIKVHEPSSDLLYKVKNPYAPEGCRDFFFFSDPPHLLKTVRNCWQSKHRQLWCNGKHISWGHLTKLYTQDTNPGNGIRMLPKLKFEHISLTSFSKMRVDLAAQVLSESVSKALKLLGGEEASETAKFADMIDKFFDALNVHNYTHGVRSRKPFQVPYTTSKDDRLKWLEKDFLTYLGDWEKSVDGRSGFTKTEKNMMLLSNETRLGLKMTTKSFVELVQYLFTLSDVKSFLSQRICQDPLERFFGVQRQRGGVHDNPNVAEFLKNTQALRVVQSLPVPKGNCRGGTQDVSKENMPQHTLKNQAQDTTPIRKRPRKQTHQPLGFH